MSERLPSGDHHKTKRATEIGIAGVGMAAAGYGIHKYMNYRREREDQHGKLNEVYSYQYRANLKCFDETRENLLVRKAMAAIAVRVFYATENSFTGVITRGQLWNQLQQAPDETLHTSKTKFNRAIGQLKRNKMIDLRAPEDDPRAKGYHHLPSLEWGMVYGDKPELLAQAEEDWYEQILRGTEALPSDNS